MRTEHLTEDHALLGGVQRIYIFPNGYGASVVRHSGSYGSEDGLWEVAVLDSDRRLTYDTPITSDVIGRLTEAGVDETLEAVASLPAAVTA